MQKRSFQINLLRGMKRIRLVEQGIAERYPDGRMRCPTHLSIGQEAAAMGVGVALKKSDLAVSTHRAHAHYLAKGGDLKSMLAEIYGKATGCCHGRGGSMHLTDTSVGFIGSTAIVGNSIPIGVGLGLSLKIKNTKNVSTVFFGDGCTEEGAFYESMNFAVVARLPILFVCENNLYSVYSSLDVRQPKGREIYKLAESIGVPSTIVDGNDVEAVYQATAKALEYVRSGKGPFFIELTTYRWLEHCGPNYDNNIGYRSEEEFLSWKARDPIQLYEDLLIACGSISSFEINEMSKDLAKEIDAAFSFAEKSPFPDENEAHLGLYA